MLQAIVFDFDGVIADSEPLHLRAAQTALRAGGIELKEHDYYERYLGYDDAGMFRAIAADQGHAMNKEEIDTLIDAKTEAWMTLVSNGSVLFPGAAACIHRCAAQRPLAIASGALGHEIELLLTRAGLRGCFGAIASASDGVPGKPAPDLYLLALSKLQQAPPVRGVRLSPSLVVHHCVAIEDSRWGIEAARAAGLRCVAITHTYPADELHAADLIVESMNDITWARLEQLCGS
jgi:beta-phosphoglucomutase-like phosphatase (HAD superfamily)